MTLLQLLRILVVAAAGFCLSAMLFLVLHTSAAGKSEFYSTPRAKTWRGIIYAFGRGMMPWEKESAGGHLPTFIGGLLYHGAIFVALLYLLWLIFFPTVARPVRLMSIVFAVGAVAGLGLLSKRIFKPHLRQLSCADDFFANLFVDLFLLLSLLHARNAVADPILMLAAIGIFVYIPLGKIRHCFFFFYTRILFGIFFGRRGVFPHPPREC